MPVLQRSTGSPSSYLSLTRAPRPSCSTGTAPCWRFAYALLTLALTGELTLAMALALTLVLALLPALAMALVLTLALAAAMALALVTALALVLAVVDRQHPTCC